MEVPEELLQSLNSCVDIKILEIGKYVIYTRNSGKAEKRDQVL